jgi:hypothetical protein
VDVPDAVGVVAQQATGIPARVRDVARVEAQADELWIRVGEEPLDLLVRLDVALDVRVEDEPHVLRAEGARQPGDRQRVRLDARRAPPPPPSG